MQSKLRTHISARFLVIYLASFLHSLELPLQDTVSLKLYCPDSRITIRVHFFCSSGYRHLEQTTSVPPQIVVAVDKVKTFVLYSRSEFL